MLFNLEMCLRIKIVSVKKEERMLLSVILTPQMIFNFNCVSPVKNKQLHTVQVNVLEAAQTCRIIFGEKPSL